MSRRSKTPSYRHWLEYPMLVFNILLLFTAPGLILLLYGITQNRTITITIETANELEDLIALAVLLVSLSAGLLLFLLTVALFSLWTARRRLNALRRGSVRVSATQIPELFHLAEEARQALGVDAAVNIYIYDSSKVQHGLSSIAVLGFRQPYFIVISTYLVSEMTPRELLYHFGCQYGHIKLGHVRMLTIIDGVSGGLGRVPFLGGFIRFAFLGWTRLAVFSADRAGLIAVRSLANAYSALVKLAINASRYDELNHVELALQAKRTRGGFFGLVNRTTMPFDAQPLGRFDRLVPFAESAQFRLLCPEASMDFAYLDCWR
jgi:Zn-dependent protease with chaperone function